MRWVGPETVGRWESIILGQLRKVFEVLPFGLTSNRQRQAESIGGGTEEDGAVDSGKDNNVDEVEHATEARHKGDQASMLPPPPKQRQEKDGPRKIKASLTR